MVEIKVVRECGYDDKELKKHVNKGDKYIVSKERAKVILATGWAIKVKEIEEVETAVKEVKKEKAVKKTTKKAK